MSRANSDHRPKRPNLSETSDFGRGETVRNVRRLLGVGHSDALRTLTGRIPEYMGSTPTDLLDMAEDVLMDHEWINRMDELRPREVSHG